MKAIKIIIILTLTLITTISFSQVSWKHYSNDHKLISKIVYKTDITFIIKTDKITEVMDGVLTMFKIISKESNPSNDEYIWDTYTCLHGGDTLKFTFIYNIKKGVRIDYTDGSYNIVRGIRKIDTTI
tara:strand:+ start:760 stop:1140 length:381 start_codon:yes stop_codon:yes gene_type:complete